jgi:hypothetical protein
MTLQVEVSKILGDLLYLAFGNIQNLTYFSFDYNAKSKLATIRNFMTIGTATFIRTVS